MSTLPLAIREDIYNLDRSDANAAAVNIISNYLNEFSAENASDDLWKLIVLMLITPNAPHIELAEERKYWLHFFEYSKAFLMAVQKLHGGKQ